MTTNDEMAKAWQSNIREKINELRSELCNFHSRLVSAGGTVENPKVANAHKQMQQIIAGLIGLYAKSKVPRTLERLQDTYNNCYAAPHDAGQYISLLKLIDNLDEILLDNDKAVFDRIFNAYRDEHELVALIANAVDLLQKVLDEDDDLLTKTVHHELEALLQRLRRHKDFSVVELNMWVDYGVLYLAALAAVTGNAFTASFIVAVQAAQKAFESTRLRIARNHSLACVETLRETGMGKSQVARKVLEDNYQPPALTYSEAPDDSPKLRTDS